MNIPQTKTSQSVNQNTPVVSKIRANDIEIDYYYQVTIDTFSAIQSDYNPTTLKSSFNARQQVLNRNYHVRENVARIDARYGKEEAALFKKQILRAMSCCTVFAKFEIVDKDHQIRRCNNKACLYCAAHESMTRMAYADRIVAITLLEPKQGAFVYREIKTFIAANGLEDLFAMTHSEISASGKDLFRLSAIRATDPEEYGPVSSPDSETNRGLALILDKFPYLEETLMVDFHHIGLPRYQVKETKTLIKPEVINLVREHGRHGTRERGDVDNRVYDSETGETYHMKRNLYAKMIRAKRKGQEFKAPDESEQVFVVKLPMVDEGDASQEEDQDKIRAILYQAYSETSDHKHKYIWNVKTFGEFTGKLTGMIEAIKKHYAINGYGQPDDIYNTARYSPEQQKELLDKWTYDLSFAHDHFETIDYSKEPAGMRSGSLSAIIEVAKFENSYHNYTKLRRAKTISQMVEDNMRTLYGHRYKPPQDE